jgi:hypothetical protein
MATSSTAYGVTAPSGLDPFPIETELAKIVAGNNPANASNLLDLYQVQNQTSQGNYNYNLNQQHEFAKQQLAQQLKETYLKEAMTAVQHRGGTSVYNQLVGPGAAINPDLTNSIEGGLTGLQNANIFEKVGTGANQGAQAGLGTSLPLASNLTGGLFNREQTPTTLQNTQYRVDNAAPKRRMVTMPIEGRGEHGEKQTFNMPVPMDATPEEMQYYRNQANRLAGGMYPQGTGIAGTTPPSGTTAPTPGPTSRPPGQNTNLPFNIQQPKRPVEMGAPPPGVVSPDDPNNLLDPTIPEDSGTSETAPPGAVAPRPPPLPGPNTTSLPPKSVQTMPPVQAPTADTSGPARTAAQPPAAQAATPPSGNAEAASAQFVLDQAIQNKAKYGLSLLPGEQKLDVQANIQASQSGAILPIVPLKEGGYGFVGRTGNVYKVPAKGAN